MQDVNGLLTLKMSNAEILFDCGKRYFEIEDFAHAKPYFERLLKAYPNDKNRLKAQEYAAVCDRKITNP